MSTRVQLWLVCLLWAVVTGCRAPQPMPSLDLGQPGWTVNNGQAVWQPSKGVAGIAGELILATRVDGLVFVQFMKTPFPMVVAQVDAHAWQIHFVPRKKLISGPGPAPGRISWFVLAAALRGSQVPPPWRFTAGPENHWRLVNERTGETLEGYVGP